jgi:hypothetical protein
MECADLRIERGATAERLDIGGVVGSLALRDSTTEGVRLRGRARITYLDSTGSAITRAYN